MNEYQQILNKYDVSYHIMILDALNWLTEKESQWNLSHPINKEEYIENLIKHMKR